jgi:DNA polymerase-3 subunit beta
VFDIHTDGTATIVKAPRSEFRLPAEDPLEFPAVASFPADSGHEISTLLVRELVRRTVFATDNESSRYALGGVLVELGDKEVTAVGTDGRRLAMVDSDLEFPASHETDVIIPTKAVQELQRLLGDAGEVIVKLSDSQISFTVGDSLLASKLIEGNYPNYRQVIPGDSNERVVIGREALLETVRRVSLLSSDKSNSVKLVFSENHIEVTANSPDVGEAQESMDVIYQGPPMQIAFNPEFLQAPLRALDSADVYLDLIDEMSPGVLRIEGTFLYVLMPMRVTN